MTVLARSRAVFGLLPPGMQAPARRLLRIVRRRGSGHSASAIRSFQYLARAAQEVSPEDLAAPLDLEDEKLPTVDVNIVTFNSAKWLRPFFDSLTQLDYPPGKMRLCIVDNSSSDDTLLVLEQQKSRLVALGMSVEVATRPNRGFGAGHNEALRLGRSEFCLITNVDLEFERSSLREAVRTALSSHGNVAAWEFRQKPFEHPKIYDPVSRETLWNSHACILMRRSAIGSVGGYCEDIFMYGEDTELSFRLRDKGFVLHYLPQAVVLHHSYDHAGQIKPLQFLGSTFANLYLRLKYGALGDKLMVPVMAGWLLARRNYPTGVSRAAVWRSLLRLASLLPSLLRTRPSGRAPFPFSGWDYGYRREGAFYPLRRNAPDAPPVSIITRTYAGRERLLWQCVVSVASQTYSNIEHVVVVDGPLKAETLAVLDGAREMGANIRWVTSQGGRSAAGNAGLRESKGLWCGFLDDDDLLYHDHVEVLVGALQDNAGARAAYSLAFDVPTTYRGSGWRTYSVQKPIQHPHMARQATAESMSEANLFPIQAVLFERTLYRDLGGFDEDVDLLEDWILWRRYISSSLFIYVPKTTSLYRTPGNPLAFAERNRDLYRARVQAERRIASTGRPPAKVIGGP